MDAKEIADWFCSGIGGIGTKQPSHLPEDCHLLKEIIAYGEAERELGRKAGREETHCKVNCGCYAYDRAFEKGREQGAFECKHAAGIVRQAALEEAATEVDSYQLNGKFEVGYGFVDNLKEIADRIRRLSKPE